MDPVVLLDTAYRAGLKIEAHDSEHLRVIGPRSAEPLVSELRARKAEILAVIAKVVPWTEDADEWVRVWTAEGLKTGHEWLYCDACGERQLLRPTTAGRECRLTPECGGHVRQVPRPFR